MALTLSVIEPGRDAVKPDERPDRAESHARDEEPGRGAEPPVEQIPGQSAAQDVRGEDSAEGESECDLALFLVPIHSADCWLKTGDRLCCFAQPPITSSPSATATQGDAPARAESCRGRRAAGG